MERKGIGSDVEKPAGAPLPAARAFVVQLRAETEPAGEIFVGRAEHMASGTAERFTSAAGLIGFITRTLAGDDGPRPGARTVTGRRDANDLDPDSATAVRGRRVAGS